MEKSIMELEEAGEILKLFEGSEKGEIICIGAVTEVNQEIERAKMKIVMTAKSADIIIKCSETIGETDLMMIATKEYEEINKKRKENIDELQKTVEKRKVELLALFEKKGFKVLYGMWIA